MDIFTKTPTTSMPITKKKIVHTRFFRHFGHDARHDWMFLLCLSGVLIVSLLTFAIWMFVGVQSEKAFSFETEPASVPSITMSTEALTQTIGLFEKKKIRFNSIRQIGVDAFDPSL